MKACHSPNRWRHELAASRAIRPANPITEWTKRTQPIKVEDTVGYSKQFLQSAAQYTGDVPHARGRVIALHQVGSESTLAEIEWDCSDLPNRVNVKNVSTVKQIQLGD